jgi:hypothetical protein
LKRVTIIFECGCSLTVWAETSGLSAAEHYCEEHEAIRDVRLPSLLPDWRGLEGKKISTVSIERR